MEWKYEEERVYGTDEEGALLAEATFKQVGSDIVNIDHTYVIPALRGRGLAAEMMAALAKHLREKGLKAAASCWYADLWLKRNRESYRDIIAGNTDSLGIAYSINAKH